MGSGKYLKTKPHTMAEEKKSIINTCKNAFKWLKGKGKETKKEKTVRTEEKIIIQPPKVTPVAELLQKLDRKETEEDEMKNFSRKLIEDDPRAYSIDSQSSVDSGIEKEGETDELADKLKVLTVEAEVKDTDNLRRELKDLKVELKDTDNLTHKLKDRKVETNRQVEVEDETDDLTNKLNDLNVETQTSVDSGFEKDAEGDGTEKERDETEKEEKKKKKLKTVFLTRGPVKTKVDSLRVDSHPYAERFTMTNHSHGQIQNVNRQTLSGGNVIVNESCENRSLEQVFNIIDKSVLDFARTTIDEQEEILSVALDYINVEQRTTLPMSSETFGNLSAFNLDQSYDNLKFGYPTPPRSYQENALSPMSDMNQTSDCSLSPNHLSPNHLSPNHLSPNHLSPPYRSPGTYSPMRNPDLEFYQPLPNYEPPVIEVDSKVEKKKSSNSLKFYKDLQKEIAGKFSKRECCQVNRKSCKDIIQERCQKLSMEDRRNVMLKAANLDMKYTCSMLSIIIDQLAKGSESEDYLLLIFSLICEKVLGQNPELFYEADFGLELIKQAALRCYSKPFLTRYLVQCTRLAIQARKQPSETPHIFTELDELGDNLLHACVRKGDMCADVLSELVRKDAEEAPLFNVHHHNKDGYLPLHLACSLHSAASPRLHAAHVLLDHAGADLWRWDVKGGETSLHLAVNAAACELRLVLLLFRRVERRDWKRLAHYKNRSSVTSLDYARTALRSRNSYPHEVLEFLQKCR